jgi:hypothetical protein
VHFRCSASSWVAMSMVTFTVLAPVSSTTWITLDRRLDARLTPGQCRELAALLDLAIAGSDIGVPGQPSR